jgi:hypothetical protein
VVRRRGPFRGTTATCGKTADFWEEHVVGLVATSVTRVYFCGQHRKTRRSLPLNVRIVARGFVQRPPSKDEINRATLAAIAKELDAAVWSPDTLSRIAEHLRHAGYEIRDTPS